MQAAAERQSAAIGKLLKVGTPLSFAAATQSLYNHYHDHYHQDAIQHLRDHQGRPVTIDALSSVLLLEGRARDDLVKQLRDNAKVDVVDMDGALSFAYRYVDGRSTWVTPTSTHTRPTHKVKTKAELLELVRKHKHGLLQEEVFWVYRMHTALAILTSSSACVCAQVEDAHARVLDDLNQLRASGEVVAVYSIEAGGQILYPVTGGMQLGQVCGWAL